MDKERKIFIECKIFQEKFSNLDYLRSKNSSIILPVIKVNEKKAKEKEKNERE